MGLTQGQARIAEIINNIQRMKKIFNKGFLKGPLLLAETVALVQNMRTFNVRREANPIMGAICIATGRLRVADSSTVPQVRILKLGHRNINLVTPASAIQGNSQTDPAVLLNDSEVSDMYNLLLSESTNLRVFLLMLVLHREFAQKVPKQERWKIVTSDAFRSNKS